MVLTSNPQLEDNADIQSACLTRHGNILLSTLFEEKCRMCKSKANLIKEQYKSGGVRGDCRYLTAQCSGWLCYPVECCQASTESNKHSFS